MQKFLNIQKVIPLLLSMNTTQSQKNTFYMAHVEHDKVQIYGMDVSNPVLSSQITVVFKVLNSNNNYLCIWTGFKKHGPPTL